MKTLLYDKSNLSFGEKKKCDIFYQFCVVQNLLALNMFIKLDIDILNI